MENVQPPEPSKEIIQAIQRRLIPGTAPHRVLACISNGPLLRTIIEHEPIGNIITTLLAIAADPKYLDELTQLRQYWKLDATPGWWGRYLQECGYIGSAW